jgi:hypothetical protein
MPSTRYEAKPTESMIWTRLIQPRNGNMSQDAARALLSLTFGEKDKERMRELAERNNEGSLSAAERAELENYVKVGDVLSLIHLKARKSLQK